jgi:hypothetical protein
VRLNALGLFVEARQSLRQWRHHGEIEGGTLGEAVEQRLLCEAAHHQDVIHDRPR